MTDRVSNVQSSSKAEHPRSRRAVALVVAILAVVVGAAFVPRARAGEPSALPNAHAHNDYLHKRPLLDALDRGFCSVEADIHLVDGELLVAHDLRQTKPDRTLRALYLDPLRERIRANGGRVHPDSDSFQLLIDLKSEGESTYAALREQLKDYAEILTRFENGETKPGAVTVVVSGATPRETLLAESPSLAAIDGRPPDLDAGAPAARVPLVSQSWGSLFKWRGKGPFPAEEEEKLKSFVARAHAQGRKVRFWAVPDREEGWKALREAGVDYINTDRLDALREFLLAD